MSGIFDKSHWPCHTEDLFWALSDSLENVGRLTNFDDESCEYVVDTSELPAGKYALWNFNALRNIRLGSDFPDLLSKKLVSMTLCLGPKALESTSDFSFAMFQNETILPFHILNDELLTVRLIFRSLNENDRQLMPRHAIKMEGLLVRILDPTRPFFVGASKDVVLTWDGVKHRVFSKAFLNDDENNFQDDADNDASESRTDMLRRDMLRSDATRRRLRRSEPTHRFYNSPEEETDNDCFAEARVWHVVHNDNTSFDELWNASNA